VTVWGMQDYGDSTYDILVDRFVPIILQSHALYLFCLHASLRE
jgi:hypothetical protein